MGGCAGKHTTTTTKAGQVVHHVSGATSDEEATSPAEGSTSRPISTASPLGMSSPLGSLKGGLFKHFGSRKGSAKNMKDGIKVVASEADKAPPVENYLTDTEKERINTWLSNIIAEDMDTPDPEIIWEPPPGRRDRASSQASADSRTTISMMSQAS
eukprot:EG_transcript_18897